LRKGRKEAWEYKNSEPRKSRKIEKNRREKKEAGESKREVGMEPVRKEWDTREKAPSKSFKRPIIIHTLMDSPTWRLGPLIFRSGRT
jgi:hypothetical protein